MPIDFEARARKWLLKWGQKPGSPEAYSTFVDERQHSDLAAFAREIVADALEDAARNLRNMGHANLALHFLSLAKEVRNAD